MKNYHKRLKKFFLEQFQQEMQVEIQKKQEEMQVEIQKKQEEMQVQRPENNPIPKLESPAHPHHRLELQRATDAVIQSHHSPSPR